MSNGGLISVGDIFGETALQSQSPYEFDVIALGNVSLLVISRESVEQLCGPIEDIVARTAAGTTLGPDSQKELSAMTESLSIEGKVDFQPYAFIPAHRTQNAFRLQIRKMNFPNLKLLHQRWLSVLDAKVYL